MQKRFLFLVALILLAPMAAHMSSAQQSESRVALLIGNAAYPDAESPLKEPVSDAKALAEELRRQGFEVDVGENLSKEAMQRALERFYGKVTFGSTALIFFSGYGIQSNRQSYMIPVNAQIWSELDVRRDGFSLDAILAQMNVKGARVKIAILDASRRNPFERRFRSYSQGLAPITAPKGTLVMCSATPGTVADDASPGLFVAELLKEMRRPGLTVEEVFNRTRMDVVRASKEQQVPWFSSSLGEEFAFSARPQAKLEPKAEPAPPAPKPAAPPPAAKSEPATPAVKPAAPPPQAKAEPKIEPAAPAARPPAPPPQAKPEPKPSEQITMPAPPPIQPKPEETAKSDVGVDDAIRQLDTRIRGNPNDIAALYTRGQLHAKNGNFSRAVKDFDEVIRLDSKDAEALNNRCWARAITGDLQGALKDCNDALQIRPRYADALDSRGLVNLKLGSSSQAIADYDAALGINPKHASSLYGRGIAKVRSGNVAGGNSDIAAAKAIQFNIADEFAWYGIR